MIKDMNINKKVLNHAEMYVKKDFVLRIIMAWIKFAEL